MKKSSSSSSQNQGYFPSPGAPNYRNQGLIGTQKGWSSERIAKSGSNSIRRHTMSGLTMTPFSGGRTMPSKWDDAERWICSPVSANNDNNNNNISSSSHSQVLQRRPKSISGPIVPPPVAYYYSNYSPTVPLRQGLVVRNLVMNSPFSTGVLAPVAVSVHHFDAHDAASFGYDTCNNGVQYSSNSPLLDEDGVEQVFSAPMSSEQPSHPSSPFSQDENHDGMTNDDTMMFSRCDKGTQMSPSETENETHLSAESSSSATSVIDRQDCHSPKLEVRDVQVDSQATVIRGSKRHSAKLSKTGSMLSKDLRESSMRAHSSSWDIEESTLDTSKLQREEAKIIAWENLQKAKAEAAIRKLEMKLEKKRSSSMDKILNKLRKAQTKAENMRNLVPTQEDNRVSKTCKVFSFPKYAQIWSPISCFSSHGQ